MNIKNPPRPKVFVTHAHPKMKQSLSLAAEDYGDVVFMSTDEYMPEPSFGSTNTNIRDQIIESMVNYRPGRDFILVSGSPISIMITGIAIGMSFNAGLDSDQDDCQVHKIMKWSGAERRYEICEVEVV